MTQIDGIRDDLAYVRGLLRRPQVPAEVAAIYGVWALIIAAGYALADFRPLAAAAYWLLAPLLGAAVSLWLGRRAQARLGERNRAAERRVLGHWAVVLIATLVASLPPYLAATLGGPLPVATGQWLQAPLLAATIGYALAGVHFHRPLLLVGALMGVCYLVVATRPDLPYLATAVGLLIGATLVAAAFTMPGAPAVED